MRSLCPPFRWPSSLQVAISSPDSASDGPCAIPTASRDPRLRCVEHRQQGQSPPPPPPGGDVFWRPRHASLGSRALSQDSEIHQAVGHPRWPLKVPPQAGICPSPPVPGGAPLPASSDQVGAGRYVQGHEALRNVCWSAWLPQRRSGRGRRHSASVGNRDHTHTSVGMLPAVVDVVGSRTRKLAHFYGLELPRAALCVRRPAGRGDGVAVSEPVRFKKAARCGRCVF